MNAYYQYVGIKKSQGKQEKIKGSKKGIQGTL